MHFFHYSFCEEVNFSKQFVQIAKHHGLKSSLLLKILRTCQCRQSLCHCVWIKQSNCLVMLAI